MAEQQQTALQRWGSKKQPWWFWLVVAGVLVAVVVGAFLLLGMSRDSRDAKIEELNDRYVEQIDLSTTSNGGSSDRELIVIDGVSRYDCSEEDGRLTCSDDPQPTEEQPSAG